MPIAGESTRESTTRGYTLSVDLSLAGLRQKGEVRQVLFCKWTTTIAFAASRRDSRGQHATAPACENSASMRKLRQQAGRRFSSRPVEAGQQSARRRCPDAVIAQATYTLLSLSISTRIVSLPLYLYTQPQTFHHPSQSHPISPPPIPAYVYVSPPPPLPLLTPRPADSTLVPLRYKCPLSSSTTDTPSASPPPTLCSSLPPRPPPPVSHPRRLQHLQLLSLSLPRRRCLLLLLFLLLQRRAIS